VLGQLVTVGLLQTNIEGKVMRIRKPVALLGCVVTALMSTLAVVPITQAAPVAATDSVVTDTNLVACIRQAMSSLGVTPMLTDGVTQDDFNHLGTQGTGFVNLNCDNMNIASLEGLQYLKFDTTASSDFVLSLVGGSISDLSPISGLKDLTELYLNNNQITDVSPLATLISLYKLDLGTNDISDISPLKPLANTRRYVELVNNHIFDLSPLNPCTKAQNTAAGQSQIACVSVNAIAQNSTANATTSSAMRLPTVTGQSDDPVTWRVMQGSAIINSRSVTFPSIGTYVLQFQDTNDTPQVRPGMSVGNLKGYDNVSQSECQLQNGTIESFSSLPGCAFDADFSGIITVTVGNSNGNNRSNGGGRGNGFSGGTITNALATDVSGTNSTSTVTQTQSSTTGGAARAADGEDAYQLQVTLRNSRGQGLAGLASHLSLTSTPAGVTLAGVTDNGNGTYTVNATSVVPGIYQVAVQCDGVAVGGLITINFIGGSVGELTVAPGYTQTLIGAGFMPGEQVTVTIHSDPITVATLTADANGLVKATWSVPAGFIIGAHVATWTSVKSGHVSTPFKVGHKGASVTTGGVIDTAMSSGMAAVVMLLIAACGVLVIRRRRQIV